MRFPSPSPRHDNLPIRSGGGADRLWRLLTVAVLAALTATTEAATLGWGDGVNLQPSYFNDGDVNLGWELMREQPKIRTVRIEIEPFVSLETARRWIAEAHANGYNIIATYHRYQANGSDDVEELLKAARWWRENYAALREAGPFTVNLMNEWGSHKQRPASFAAACNAAIAIVREVYDGPLIVDIPGWAQETQVACEASPSIPDQNIVFSVHIYSSGWVEYGSRGWMQPKHLDVLDGCGRPVLVGEFGGRRKGRANWSRLVDHAKAKGWTLLAWAWNGDGERMNMVRPYWGDDPQAERFSKTFYFRSAYRKLRDPEPASE